MRILHVLDVSIPMLAGYTSRSRYIANAQKSLGLEPVVVTSVRQENPQRVESEELDGIRYYRTLPPTSSAVLRRMGAAGAIKEAREIQQLRRRVVDVAKREQPDLVHAHSSILCGIPGLLAARQIGVPCVYEIRAFWEDAAVDLGRATPGSARYRATRRAETILARNADAVVAICEGMRGDLEQRGIASDRVYVVPNGVDTENFKPLERDEQLAKKLGLSGKTVVSYIGTFARFEGVPNLVRALADLIGGGRDDLRGLIIGQGRCYDECRGIAEAAGLSDKILHPGRVSHHDVQSFYSISDILAYPRLRKRVTELVTPLKPLEAMAMEKAVVGSDVGGLRELISHETTGLLYPAEEPAALKDAILRLANSDELRAELGRRARKHVCEHRQWRRIVRRHFPLYEVARERRDAHRRLWATTARLFGNRLC